MITALGKISVPTPGTIVRVTSGLSNPALNLGTHGILIQALPTNTGKIYIGSSALVKATYVGCYAILPVPTTNFLPTFSASITISPNGLSLERFYIDADNADEGVIVTYLVA